MSAINTEVSAPRAETEQQKRSRVFHQVTQAYVDIRSLSPIVAVNYDDEAKPNRKLNADVIHFICDVESATRKALDNDANLLEQWDRLVYQEAQVPNAAKIASRCGRMYQKRLLAPHEYFRHIKRGTPGLARVPVSAMGAAA